MEKKKKTIVTAVMGTNSDLFSDVVAIHFPYGGAIADVTYGKGRFWKNVCDPAVTLLATDLLEEPIPPNKCVGWGTPIGGWQQDFCQLSYPSDYLDGLVLDPPYMYNPKRTVKASVADCYNVNETPHLRTTTDVVNYYLSGMLEARRVLKPKGVLVVKCQDNIESGKQRWVHCVLMSAAENMGYMCDDLFVLVQRSIPTMRHKRQLHARKNHSYFLVFRKRR